MSSVALAAALPYPGKATRISHKGKKTYKKTRGSVNTTLYTWFIQKNKGVSKYYPLYLIYTKKQGGQ